MQEICSEIGLDSSVVYRYFNSKDAVIEAMVEEERQQARGDVDPTLDAPPPCRITASATAA